MSFSHVNSFDTDNPDRLSRQLSQMEDNISAECASIRAQTLPVPTIATFTALASAVANIIAIGTAKQLSVDSANASLTVLFPPITAALIGQRFTLIRRSSANNVVTANQVAGTLCNGSATWPTFTGATPRVIEFYCDSSGYFYQ